MTPALIPGYPKLQCCNLGIDPEKEAKFRRLFADTWSALPATDQTLLRGHWDRLVKTLPVVLLFPKRYCSQGKPALQILVGGGGLRLDLDRLCETPDDGIKLLLAEALAHHWLLANDPPSAPPQRLTDPALHRARILERKKDAGAVVRRWGFSGGTAPAGTTTP